ncbi:PPE domain-containing protein [Saccharothrix lopnurensis]|uniref:PPE domain-containing protein n=1 Tax=Saccharothrix lopnurensis TaxID=1670621 RepID=A0ABW1NYR0_9PSEU
MNEREQARRARRQARRVRQENQRKDQVERNRELRNFGRINWEAYPHRRLWDMVMSSDAAVMSQRTWAWQRLAADVDQTTARVQGLVQRLAMSWRGPSAGVAAASVTRLTRWAADASERTYQVGTGLERYTEAVDEARRRMPVPVHPTAERWFEDGRDVSTLDGPEGAYMLDQLLDDHMPSKKEQQRARAEAVRVMTEFEDASRAVHTSLPEVFQQAPEGASTVRPDHRLPTPPNHPPIPPNHEVRPPDPPQVPVPPVVPTPPPVVEPLPPARPDDTTGVAGVGQPGAPALGAPGAAGGYGSFGPTGGGAAGGGGRGGGGPGGAAGFGPVGSGTTSGVLGAVPGGAAARGGFGPVTGAGGPQGFGMHPPMAPANRAEDSEHRNRYDLGLDLLDDLPPAYPPVLGE